MSSPKGFFGTLKTLVTALVSLVGLGFLLAWMGGAFISKVPPGEHEVPREKVDGRALVKVERKKSPEVVIAVGSVQPRRRTEVAGQLLASVLEVKVQPGDRVKKGDPLIILDDREIMAQEREAAASLTAAEADLITRRAELERLRTLRQSGAISAIEYSKVEGGFKVGESQVIRAKEAIGRLAIQQTYTRILATTNGVVADRFVDPGDLAAPGKPLLLVYDPMDLELHINIPESISHLIRVGQELSFQIDAAELNSHATVREIVPQAQQSSRSVLVKLTLPKHNGRPLLPGMFARLGVSTGNATGLWVPAKAVRQTGQLELVDVSDNKGHLERRFVRTGALSGDTVEILSGLAEGETVALPKS